MDISLHSQVYPLLVDVLLPIACSKFERSADFHYLYRVRSANSTHKAEYGTIGKITIFINFCQRTNFSSSLFRRCIPFQTFLGCSKHLRLKNRVQNRTTMNDPVEVCHQFSDKSALESL